MAADSFAAPLALRRLGMAIAAMTPIAATENAEPPLAVTAIPSGSRRTTVSARFHIPIAEPFMRTPIEEA